MVRRTLNLTMRFWPIPNCIADGAMWYDVQGGHQKGHNQWAIRRVYGPRKSLLRHISAQKRLQGHHQERQQTVQGRRRMEVLWPGLCHARARFRVQQKGSQGQSLLRPYLSAAWEHCQNPLFLNLRAQQIQRKAHRPTRHTHLSFEGTGYHVM